jgi:hypothetical protein
MQSYYDDHVGLDEPFGQSDETQKKKKERGFGQHFIYRRFFSIETTPLNKTR